LKTLGSLDLPSCVSYFNLLLFETLMGVFRIRPQCGKFGCMPRMTLGLVKNASKHYMAKIISLPSSLSSKHSQH